jgi:PAS domain S-box-containing protein
MTNRLKVLIIEDNPAHFLLIERRLRFEGLKADCVRIDSMPELESSLHAQPWDVVFADYTLPELRFEQALAFIRYRAPDLPVIAVTGTLGEEKVVDLLKQGCSDVVLKSDLSRLVPALKRSLQDVAEKKARRMVEDALHESEERFHVAAESIRDAFVIADSSGRVVWWNLAAQTMFGYNRKEILGKMLHNFIIPPRYRKAAVEGVERFAASGVGDLFGRTVDLAGMRKNGDEFPIELSLSSMRLHDHLFAVGIVRDITDRKCSERALARSSRALKTISAANQALIRATGERELLQSVTRVIVDSGGYGLAIIGYAVDDARKSIDLMAWSSSQPAADSAAALIDDLASGLSWADEASSDPTRIGQTPVGRTLRGGGTQVCRNIAAHNGYKPWRDAARALGFASNIVSPLFDGEKIFGGLSIYSSELDAFDEEEARLLQELADDLSYGVVTLRTRAERDRIADQHERSAETLRQSLEQTVGAIADTVEARDAYTAGHQRRVTGLAIAIAREMGLPDEQIRGLHLAASIHDMGKLRIPSEILAKPSRLSSIETMMVKTHPQAGYDILKEVSFPWPIAEIVWQHHEKLDGAGYPRGLKGDEILLESKILTVADVVEAMSSHRPYRPALGVPAALDEIREGRGRVYDPGVVDACLKLVGEGRFAF